MNVGVQWTVIVHDPISSFLPSPLLLSMQMDVNWPDRVLVVEIIIILSGLHRHNGAGILFKLAQRIPTILNM